MVRFGVTLPQFRDDPEPVLEQAVRAEAAGLSGVFLYDHLFRVDRSRTGADGAPEERPALDLPSLLGAVAVETRTITVGSLVARATLRPPLLSAAMFSSAIAIGGGAPGGGDRDTGRSGRIVAALGSGDRESQIEHDRFGIPMGSLAARVERLADTVECCRAVGITTWVGGAHHDVLAVAGSRADGWNRWGGSPDELRSGRAIVRRAAEDAGRNPAEVVVTWGGVLDLTRPAAELVGELVPYVEAGAEWIIVGPRDAAAPEASAIVAELAAQLGP